jgi:imidazolonepropionase-like amidohydrolase
MRSVLVSLLFASLAFAQATRQVTAIRAGKLLDVRQGRLLDDRVIVVENGEITAVTPFAQWKNDANAKMIDLRDRTVLPGLMDSHVHITFPSNGTPNQWFMTSPSRASLIGARNARTLLEAGFTTIRNLGAQDYADITPPW